MFQHNDMFCKIQCVTHDLLSKETSATMYIYCSEADATDGINKMSSMVYVLPYDKSVLSPEDVELAVKDKFMLSVPILEKSKSFIGVFGKVEDSSKSPRFSRG